LFVDVVLGFVSAGVLPSVSAPPMTRLVTREKEIAIFFSAYFDRVSHKPPAEDCRWRFAPMTNRQE
jgi:hypothetical protein